MKTAGSPDKSQKKQDEKIRDPNHENNKDERQEQVCVLCESYK